MSFDTLHYFIFLPLVYGLYRSLPFRGQNWMLLAASYFFYGCWDPRFLVLIVVSTAMDYCAALVLDRGAVEHRQGVRILGFTTAAAALALIVDWRGLFGGGGGHLFTANNLQLLAALAAATAVAWVAYHGLVRLPIAARRKATLIVSMTGNLAMLGFFKYFNFFVDSAQGGLAALGFDPSGWRLEIVLPVGISFYTFQTMSYTIDVYRRKLAATDRVIDFALFVAYFPQLVAGPIERATRLLPQIAAPRQPTWEQATQGLLLILLGLFKKVAIADGVAASVSSVYEAGGGVTWADVIAATVLFAVQIYCDFSGYSDVARGTSKLFGIELMHNFRTPYFAANPREFWQRWHISLSTWLRDYLYVPLGGNRSGRAKTYRNLMLTMLLGGLWHGAAWNFVLWGLFHGALLSIHRAIGGDSGQRARPVVGHFAAVAGFFALTCYGWLLFRATSLHQVAEFTRILFADFGNLDLSIARPTFAAMAGMPLLLLLDITEYRTGLDRLRLSLWPALRGGAYAAMLFVLLMGSSHAPQQFIYFQF